MHNSSNAAGIPPRPWTVWKELTPLSNEEECWGIIDAEGQEVIVTDAGYYPPNLETAEFICKCVNEAGPVTIL